MAGYLKTENHINQYLIANDPSLKKIIDCCGHIEIKLSEDYFAALAGSIVGQQLSNKVAEVIWSRVISLLNGSITPESVLAMEDESFRRIGISYAKIRYIKNLSEAILYKNINLSDFQHMEDDDIINKLTTVKGIGCWTAEMFLIFSLGRTDVFSFGDGGLQRSVKWLYQMEENPRKSELETISGKWHPYRTFASLYLWEAINRGLKQ